MNQQRYKIANRDQAVKVFGKNPAEYLVVSSTADMEAMDETMQAHGYEKDGQVSTKKLKFRYLGNIPSEEGLYKLAGPSVKILPTEATSTITQTLECSEYDEQNVIDVMCGLGWEHLENETENTEKPKIIDTCQFRVKIHEVLLTAVDEGVRGGWARAHKYDDNPDKEILLERIVDAVLGALYDWFEIPENT